MELNELKALIEKKINDLGYELVSFNFANGTLSLVVDKDQDIDTLGITYYLHCAWRPQSSGKVERANQFLKSTIKKKSQETSLGWKEALQRALLCIRIAPKEQVGLNPYEMLCGRHFV